MSVKRVTRWNWNSLQLLLIDRDRTHTERWRQLQSRSIKRKIARQQKKNHRQPESDQSEGEVIDSIRTAHFCAMSDAQWIYWSFSSSLVQKSIPSRPWHRRSIEVARSSLLHRADLRSTWEEDYNWNINQSSNFFFLLIHICDFLVVAFCSRLFSHLESSLTPIRVPVPPPHSRSTLFHFDLFDMAKT